MKLTSKMLRGLIREELEKTLKEDSMGGVRVFDKELNKDFGSWSSVEGSHGEKNFHHEYSKYDPIAIPFPYQDNPKMVAHWILTKHPQIQTERYPPKNK